MCSAAVQGPIAERAKLLQKPDSSLVQDSSMDTRVELMASLPYVSSTTAGLAHPYRTERMQGSSEALPSWVSCATLGPAQACFYCCALFEEQTKRNHWHVKQTVPLQGTSKRLAVASLPCTRLICAQLCLQGMLKRLAAATQPFSFSEIAESAEVAHRIAHSTANTGTYQDLLRAAVASIVRPSSR